MLELTNTETVTLLIAYAADTTAQWHQPITISSTVQPRCVTFLSVLNTRSPDLHQWRRIHPRYSVGEGCKVSQGRRALFVINSHRHQGDTCPRPGRPSRNPYELLGPLLALRYSASEHGRPGLSVWSSRRRQWYRFWRIRWDGNEHWHHAAHLSQSRGG